MNLSTNQIRIQYEIDTSKIEAAKAQFDKLSDSERALLEQLKKFQKEFQKSTDTVKTETEKQKTETDQLKNKIASITGPIASNRQALSAFTNQLRSAGQAASDAAQKAKAGFAGAESAQRANIAAANAFKLALAKVHPEVEKIKTETVKTANETKKLSESTNSYSDMLGKVGKVAAGVFAASQIIAFGKQVIDTTIKFEGLNKAIEFASGSSEAYAKNNEFLRDTIQKYGLDLRSTTEAYKQFFTASTLAGQSQEETNKQFLAVSKAATVMKLSADQTNGAFMALGQMMSKGTVQAEELRGQLGERIPGAFSIMARALNVNEKQLNKMLEQGQVLSKDALPAFAAELEKTFGKSAENNLNGMVNSQNRFNSAMDGLILAIGQKLQPFLQGSYDLAAGIAKELTKAAGGGQSEVAKKNAVEAVAQRRTENEIVKAIIKSGLNLNKQEHERLRVRIAQQKLLELDAKISEQITKVTDAKVAAAAAFNTKKILELEEAERELAILREQDKILTKIAGVEIGPPKEKVVELTEEERKELEKQYQAKLKLLDVEERIALIRAKIDFEDPVQLATEELLIRKRFTGQKIALDKEAEKIGIQGAKEARRLRAAELEGETEDTRRNVRDIGKDLRKRYEQQLADEADFDRKRGLDQEKQLEKQKQLDADVVDSEQKKAEAIAKIDENSKQEKEKLYEELEQLSEMQAQKEIELAQTISNGLFSIYQGRLSNEMTALQNRYSEEIRLAGDNEQKVNELRQKQREEEKVIKEKQFRAEQLQAATNVLFNAAPQIVKYAVTAPPLAALIATIAATQTALIFAQPVPEYAEGTKGKKHKGGKAIVGERGVEKVVTESGQVYFTPPHATLLDLPKGAEVIPNHELSRKEIFYATSTTNQRPIATQQDMPVAAIVDAIGKLPITSLTMDKKGFEVALKKPKYTQKVLNNRFANSRL